MKLLFAIKRLELMAGGAERVLCTICSELADRGHAVCIVTFDRLGSSPFYPLSERVQLINLGTGESEKPAKLGITIHRIIQLRRLIKQEQPQVAIGFMCSMYVPLVFSCLLHKTRIIASEHSVRVAYKKKCLTYILILLSSFKVKKITAPSKKIISQYHPLIRRKMVALPNPVTTKNPAIMQKKMNGENKIILNVGRFVYPKNQEMLIKSFALISRQFPDWTLRIIGEGPLKHRLETLIGMYKLTEKVTMPGITRFIDSEYSNASLFVISSWYEAFGLVTAEAMSHGLPVVGFADCLGTNALIANGQTGLLVDPGDDRSAALASGLQELMSDADLRDTIGRKARQYIAENYSKDRIVDAWESLIMSVSSQ